MRRGACAMTVTPPAPCRDTGKAALAAVAADDVPAFELEPQPPKATVIAARIPASQAEERINTKKPPHSGGGKASSPDPWPGRTTLPPRDDPQTRVRRPG